MSGTSLLRLVYQSSLASNLGMDPTWIQDMFWWHKDKASRFVEYLKTRAIAAGFLTAEGLRTKLGIACESIFSEQGHGKLLSRVAMAIATKDENWDVALQLEAISALMKEHIAETPDRAISLWSKLAHTCWFNPNSNQCEATSNRQFVKHQVSKEAFLRAFISVYKLMAEKKAAAITLSSLFNESKTAALVEWLIQKGLVEVISEHDSPLLEEFFDTSEWQRFIAYKKNVVGDIAISFKHSSTGVEYFTLYHPIEVPDKCFDAQHVLRATDYNQGIATIVYSGTIAGRRCRFSRTKGMGALYTPTTWEVLAWQVYMGVKSPASFPNFERAMQIVKERSEIRAQSRGISAGVYETNYKHEVQRILLDIAIAEMNRSGYEPTKILYSEFPENSVKSTLDIFLPPPLLSVELGGKIFKVEYSWGKTPTVTIDLDKAENHGLLTKDDENTWAEDNITFQIHYHGKLQGGALGQNPYRVLKNFDSGIKYQFQSKHGQITSELTVPVDALIRSWDVFLPGIGKTVHGIRYYTLKDGVYTSTFVWKDTPHLDVEQQSVGKARALAKFEEELLTHSKLLATARVNLVAIQNTMRNWMRFSDEGKGRIARFLQNSSGPIEEFTYAELEAFIQEGNSILEQSMSHYITLCDGDLAIATKRVQSLI